MPERHINTASAIFDRLTNLVYVQQAHSNLTIRAVLTVMPVSMLSSASIFSSSVSSPSNIPLMYDPKTPSSVFSACNFLLNQLSNEFVATAMFGVFPTPLIGNARIVLYYQLLSFIIIHGIRKSSIELLRNYIVKLFL